MRRICLILSLFLVVVLSMPVVMLAASNIDNALYYGIIKVSNNSTAAENVATTANISNQVLIDGGYMNSSANNVVIRNSAGADVAFMPSVNATYPWTMFVPDIEADSYLNYILYTAESTGGKIRYFPDGAGMTTADNTTLELGDNFTIEQKGWVDTTAGSDKNLIYKEDAFRTYISGSENITSSIDNLPSGSYDTNDDDYMLMNSTDDWEAQSFDATASVTIATVQLLLYRDLSPGVVTVNITAVDGAGKPTGADLAVGTTDGDTLTTNAAGEWREISLTPYTLSPGTQYALIIRASAADSSNKLFWRVDLSSPTYTDGQRVYSTDGGSGWTTDSDKDFMFRVFGFLEVTATGISSGEHTVKTELTPNLLAYSSFEDGDPPTGWDAGYSAILSRVDTSDPNLTSIPVGTYCIKIVAQELYSQARQVVTSGDSYAGQQITLAAWCYAPSTNDKNQRIYLYDGVSAYDSSSIPKDDAWHWITLSVTLSESASQIRVSLFSQDSADTDDILYVDGAVLILQDEVADYGNFVISIDGSETGVWTDNITNCYVPNTSANWTFFQNDVMPYMEYQKIWVDGVLQQHIIWEYDDTTFTDQSGNNHDATPTFRTSSSDADVSAELVSFQPVAEAKAPAYTLTEAPPFITTVPEVTGEFTTEPPTATFPLAGVIKAVADVSGTPSQLPLLIVVAFIILAISLSLSAVLRQHGSGSLMVKIIVIVGLMGIFIAIGEFGVDFWMLLFFIIIAIALAMMSRQTGWT